MLGAFSETVATAGKNFSSTAGLRRWLRSIGVPRYRAGLTDIADDATVLLHGGDRRGTAHQGYYRFAIRRAGSIGGHPGVPLLWWVQPPGRHSTILGPFRVEASSIESALDQIAEALGDMAGLSRGVLGRSVLGLGDVDADISTSTEGVFANGFLRGLLKLAVPVLVIGAGVALGHRWAGITREGNRRRNGKRRRRNPPYRVKGMAATLADARKAYDLLPAGYRSIVDHQAGRAYKKRKVVAESRRPR